MAHEIIYPKQTTYYICYNADRSKVTAQGTVEPTLQMQTGQPILDTFKSKSKWIDKLKTLGIDTEDAIN